MTFQNSIPDWRFEALIERGTLGRAPAAAYLGLRTIGRATTGTSCESRQAMESRLTELIEYRHLWSYIIASTYNRRVDGTRDRST